MGSCSKLNDYLEYVAFIAHGCACVCVCGGGGGGGKVIFPPIGRTFKYAYRFALTSLLSIKHLLLLLYQLFG